MQIKNKGVIPIIPGEIHFKLSNKVDEGVFEPINVVNHTVEGKDNSNMISRVVEGSSQTDIIFELWEPILPDFYMPVKIHYEFEFRPKGILFYYFSLPLSSSTIPISHENVRYEFSNSLHVTYAPDSNVGGNQDYNFVEFSSPKEVEFEISRIPFPQLGFKIANMFWGIIILLLIIAVVFSFKKKDKKGY